MPVKDSQSGIALLIVLWILVILMVMAFSFAVMTRSENQGLLAFKEGLEEKFLAEAGVNRGIMEIMYRSVNLNQAAFAGREVWRLDGRPYEVLTGKEGYRVRIMNEKGKISLNSMTDASGIILKNLLINRGVSPETADVIVDSILDWKDGDDLHRLSGAEDDYYLSLPNPYKARNADFETLEELIYVRGMTPEILYGEDQKKGLISFLSITGKTNSISLNEAPQEILAALPGMNAEKAARLMEFRAAAEIRSAEDVKDIIGESYPLAAPYLVSTAETGTSVFSIEATGFKGNRKSGYTITATVVFDSPQKYYFRYYKSPADITP